VLDLTEVKGHTNCVGCNQALNASRLPAVPPSQPLQRYIVPLVTLAKALATEDGPPTLDLLVEVSDWSGQADSSGKRRSAGQESPCVGYDQECERDAASR
jgi:hypothetical protein